MDSKFAIFFGFLCMAVYFWRKKNGKTSNYDERQEALKRKGLEIGVASALIYWIISVLLEIQWLHQTDTLFFALVLIVTVQEIYCTYNGIGLPTKNGKEIRFFNEFFILAIVSLIAIVLDKFMLSTIFGGVFISSGKLTMGVIFLEICIAAFICLIITLAQRNKNIEEN